MPNALTPDQQRQLGLLYGVSPGMAEALFAKMQQPDQRLPMTMGAPEEASGPSPFNAASAIALRNQQLQTGGGVDPLERLRAGVAQDQATYDRFAAQQKPSEFLVPPYQPPGPPPQVPMTMGAPEEASGPAPFNAASAIMARNQQLQTRPPDQPYGSMPPYAPPPPPPQVPPGQMDFEIGPEGGQPMGRPGPRTLGPNEPNPGPPPYIGESEYSKSIPNFGPTIMRPEQLAPPGPRSAGPQDFGPVWPKGDDAMAQARARGSDPAVIPERQTDGPPIVNARTIRRNPLNDMGEQEAAGPAIVNARTIRRNPLNDTGEGPAIVNARTIRRNPLNDTAPGAVPSSVPPYEVLDREADPVTGRIINPQVDGPVAPSGGRGRLGPKNGLLDMAIGEIRDAATGGRGNRISSLASQLGLTPATPKDVAGYRQGRRDKITKENEIANKRTGTIESIKADMKAGRAPDVTLLPGAYDPSQSSARGLQNARAKFNMQKKMGEDNLEAVKKTTPGSMGGVYGGAAGADALARADAVLGGDPAKRAAAMREVVRRQTEVAGPDDLRKRFARAPQIPRPEGVNTAGDTDAKYRAKLLEQGDTEGAKRYMPGPDNWRNSPQGQAAHTAMISRTGSTFRELRKDYMDSNGGSDKGFIKKWTDAGNILPSTVENQGRGYVSTQATKDKRAQAIEDFKGRNYVRAYKKGLLTPQAVNEGVRQGYLDIDAPATDAMAKANARPAYGPDGQPVAPRGPQPQFQNPGGNIPGAPAAPLPSTSSADVHAEHGGNIENAYREFMAARTTAQKKAVMAKWKLDIPTLRSFTAPLSFTDQLAVDYLPGFIGKRFDLDPRQKKNAGYAGQMLAGLGEESLPPSTYDKDKEEIAAATRPVLDTLTGGLKGAGLGALSGGLPGMAAGLMGGGAAGYYGGKKARGSKGSSEGASSKPAYTVPKVTY